MLSVHANAYFSPQRHRRGIPALKVLPLARAADTLRCDPSPGSWSRRRRAIAKLMAYEWPHFEDRTLIERRLGARVDAIRARMKDLYGSALDKYIRTSPVRLETALLQLLADEPSLMPAPEGAPPVDPSECAKSWKPVQDPTVDDNSTSVTIHTHISIAGVSRDDVAKNVDPQRWDECSKFWPTPPPESTCLAKVKKSKCQVTDWNCTTPVTAGSSYTVSPLYEHFVCDVDPCDCEFENILNVSASFQPHPLPGGTPPSVQEYITTYALPVCAFAKFDGAISGRIGTNYSVRASIDDGWVEVWEEGGRTHVEANKFVAFTNNTETSTAGAILGFAELNEELAELACCLDGNTAP